MTSANAAIEDLGTTAGAAPGTDRLEVDGDKGKNVSEGGKLSLRMNRVGAKEVRETTTQSFATPEVWDVEVPGAKGARPALGRYDFYTLDLA